MGEDNKNTNRCNVCGDAYLIQTMTVVLGAYVCPSCKQKLSGSFDEFINHMNRIKR